MGELNLDLSLILSIFWVLHALLDVRKSSSAFAPYLPLNDPIMGVVWPSELPLKVFLIFSPRKMDVRAPAFNAQHEPPL